VSDADSHSAEGGSASGGKGCPYEDCWMLHPPFYSLPSREGKISSLSLDRFDELTTSGRGLGRG